MAIFSQEAGSYYKVTSLRLNQDYNYLEFYVDASTTGGLWYTQDNSITTDQWNHIVLTYDGSSLSNDPVIYINGKRQEFQNDTNPVGTVSTSTHNWYIGALEAGSEYYTGLMDDLKVYSSALTADQVKIDYNAGAALNIGTTAASESAQIRMDQETASYLLEFK